MTEYERLDLEFLENKELVLQRIQEFKSSLSLEDFKEYYYSKDIIKDFCERYLYDELSMDIFMTTYPNFVEDLEDIMENAIKM